MTKNQERSVELRISMPEMKRSDFIENELEKLNELAKRKRGYSSKPLIQRVPPILRGLKADSKEYFEPKLVPLGPLHHGKEKFEQAELTKRKFALRFAEENKTTPIALFDKIMAEIDGLKECYNQEDIKDFSDEKLAWMFFVDGCAVLITIRYGLEGTYVEKLDIKADLLMYAQLDLFLLENQLPYRVFEILIQATENQQWADSVKEYLHSNLIIQTEKKSENIPLTKGQDEARGQDEAPAHLLQRFRSLLTTGSVEKSESCIIGSTLLHCVGSIDSMLRRCVCNQKKMKKCRRSITELKESGITVKPNDSNNMKNISFHSNIMGQLKMPRFIVDDSTACLFMNLIALEMCRDFQNDFEVTNYLCFLDSLIDTAEDAKELRVRGVLQNFLGSDQQVADLFNKLSKDLVPDQEKYEDVKEKINQFCNNPLPTTLAQGYYTHFSSPWSFLAFAGAITGLVFSGFQAFAGQGKGNCGNYQCNGKGI